MYKTKISYFYNVKHIFLFWGKNVGGCECCKVCNGFKAFHLEVNISNLAKVITHTRLLQFDKRGYITWQLEISATLFENTSVQMN